MFPLFILLMATPAPLATSPVPAIACMADDVDDAIKAAGDDVEALLKLASKWTDMSDEPAARRAWARVLELQPSSEEAHTGLRHHLFGGIWYETYAALSKAKRSEAERRLKEEGLAPFGGDWVPVHELPFHRMKWEKLPTGKWAPAGTLARMEDEKAKLAEGWQLQHRTWVAPEELDQWRAGKWKVGGAWLDLAAANAAHSELGSWWEMPGEHFVALTTVPEDQARWVNYWADQVPAELERMFGLKAETKPEFVVLDSIAQYNDFAGGSIADGRQPADVSGQSAVHYAFFTDGWVDVTGPSPLFRGTGAAYYDVQDPSLTPFGQHAVRHAAALAWLESVDPSWEAVSLMITSPGGAFPDARYWEEKRIPRWLRYGAAAYCERFLEDKSVPEGGDPLWARSWALQNLRSGGPMDSIDEILELALDTNDPAGSVRLLHEAGLVLHYLIDGDDKKAKKAYDAYRVALSSGADAAEPLADLEEFVRRAAGKIAAYGGL